MQALCASGPASERLLTSLQRPADRRQLDEAYDVRTLTGRGLRHYWRRTNADGGRDGQPTAGGAGQRRRPRPRRGAFTELLDAKRVPADPSVLWSKNGLVSDESAFVGIAFTSFMEPLPSTSLVAPPAAASWWSCALSSSLCQRAALAGISKLGSQGGSFGLKA